MLLHAVEPGAGQRGRHAPDQQTTRKKQECRFNSRRLQNKSKQNINDHANIRVVLFLPYLPRRGGGIPDNHHVAPRIAARLGCQ